MSALACYRQRRPLRYGNASTVAGTNYRPADPETAAGALTPKARKSYDLVMPSDLKWQLALAEFEAIRAHVPPYVSQKFVNDYHAVLDKMADASGENLGPFRVPASELGPRVISIQRGSSRAPGTVNYSKESFCDSNFFARKIDALARYLPNIEERMGPEAAPDESRDYWSMSTPQLEALAGRFGIGAYADQLGHIDRATIIDQLLNRERSLSRGSTSKPSALQPSRASRILTDLLDQAASLRSEPFSSPKREEWTDTVSAALRKIFGPDDPIIKNFSRAQGIIFKQGDTQENLRKAANDTLASEEAALRSAITQLGWDDPPTQQARPEDDPREEVEITENGHTYLLRDRFVFEDGEKWEGAEVDIRGNGAALVGIFKGKSVENISLLPFTTIKRLFHYIEIWLPNAEKNLLDWDFAYMEAGPFPESGDNVEVQFRIGYDLEFWKKSYSLFDLANAIEDVLAANELRFEYWQENKNTAINGFGVSATMILEQRVGDGLALRTELSRLSDLVRAKLNDMEGNALQVSFDFPAPIKNACEQYLMYFSQFLRDLGINATAKLEESAHSVLFSVIPEDGKEALEKVQEALRIYLGMPTAPSFAGEAAKYTDIAVVQLQANVLHLQSQVILAKAVLQTQVATIEAKGQTILALQERLDLRALQPISPLAKDAQDKEELVKDLVAIKKFDYKFIELNLPEVLRRMKRVFNKD